MGLVLFLLRKNANRTPSGAREEDAPPDSPDSLLLAEEDSATNKHQHLCCQGTGESSGCPSASPESKADERTGDSPSCSPPPDPAILELFKKLCFPLWGQDQDAASRLDSQKCNQVRQVPSDPRASPAPSLAPLPFTEHSLAFSNAT